MWYTLRSSSRPRWSPACDGLGGGGGLILLSWAARVQGEGLSPDALSSGSVCMFAAPGGDREGARLGCAAVRGVVLEVPAPRFSVMFSSVVDVASLVIVCLHRSLGGRCGTCRLGVTGLCLFGHGGWCHSHVDFGGPCLVAPGPPGRVRRCVWWCVRALWPFM